MMENHRWARMLAALSCVLVAVSIARAKPDDVSRLAEAHPGLHVLLGADADLAAALARPDGSIVHCLWGDKKDAEQLRATVRKRKLAGRVSVEHLASRRLPYADNLVNLLVASDLGDVRMAEVMRVLAPLAAAYVKTGNKWTKTVKPWPADIDEWTHYLHDAGGNPVARDRVAGEPHRLQWAAKPLWSRHHNTVQSVSAMVSAAGRLLAIVDEAPPGRTGKSPDQWALVARDAFNGLLLWRKPIAEWGWKAWSADYRSRFNQPTQVTRRLVAAGDRVYATLGFNAPLTALDARTGRVVRTYSNTAYTSEIYHHDGLLILSVNNGPQAPGDRKSEGPEPVTKRLQVMRADTGKLVWKKGDYVGLRSKTHSVARISHLTPAISDGRVVFINRDSLVCLSLKDGKELWRVKRPAFEEHKMRYEIRISDMCTLVAHGGKVYLAQIQPDRRIDWRSTKATMHVFDGATGKHLWQRDIAEWGWAHPTDIFCHSGLVWVHDYKESLVLGLDPDTGRVKRKTSNHKAFNNGHHHRCYRNKATERFMFTGYRGTELIDWDKGTVSLNHWVRGSCRLGVMPCNGLLYATPHPCDCYIQSKLNGFVALGPRNASPARPAKPRDRLEKGPAYGKIGNGKSEIGNGKDWPTYRHDPQRSGVTAGEVSAKLKPLWQVDLGGRPSACTVAGGSVYVSCLDDHSVYALDSGSGKQRWRVTAGGNVNTPPTVHGGLVLFGSADGTVHCVRAADGRTVWRFRPAPADPRIIAYGRLESVRPVHGSVLVRPSTGSGQGVAHVVAGRSSFLDGGLIACRLDVKTGKLLEEKKIHTPHDMKVNWGRDQAVFTGAKSDILVAGDAGVYLRQILLFPNRGAATTKPSRHIRTTAGFLDDSWFNRTGFFLGREPCGEYVIAAGGRSFGVKAYPRLEANTGFFTFADKGYEVYCADTTNRPAPKPPRRKRPRKPITTVPRTGRPSSGSNSRFEKPSKRLWQIRLPIRVIAMVRAGGTLFAAGTPDVLDKADPYAAYRGARGGLMKAIAVADGKILAEYKLDAAPVYDGLAAAGGRLYVSTTTGKIICFGPK